MNAVYGNTKVDPLFKLKSVEDRVAEFEDRVKLFPGNDIFPQSGMKFLHVTASKERNFYVAVVENPDHKILAVTAILQEVGPVVIIETIPFDIPEGTLPSEISCIVTDATGTRVALGIIYPHEGVVHTATCVDTGWVKEATISSIEPLGYSIDFDGRGEHMAISVSTKNKSNTDTSVYIYKRAGVAWAFETNFSTKRIDPRNVHNVQVTFNHAGTQVAIDAEVDTEDDCEENLYYILTNKNGEWQ